MNHSNEAGRHARTSRFALARAERWILPRVAAALPPRIMPDHLTLLGLAGAAAVGVAYALSGEQALWLWAATAFLVIQWLGDSLDGTLARVRRIERPRYGFYLDHLTDAYSTFAIGLGLGLSPYMLLSVALANVIAYLVLSINVYLETHVYGEFNFGYSFLGPTEARVLLVALNTLAALVGPLPFALLGIGATIFDVVGILTCLGMVGLLAARVAHNLRRLGRLEPAGSPRAAPPA